MQSELQSMSGMDELMADNPEIDDFAHNVTVPNASWFLAQLDIVDNAACSWLALLDGISLNVFQGFKTEQELVSYAMHKAYLDNVTVLAGMYINMTKLYG